ncbi:hypothetical protein BSK59_13270 [Paenibacillus odorifer]|uniref:hypothetical protein n=1 Tax=Paenibacillus odorifer TaxID=189426 RepID=UPI00096D8DD8|nr:hypothetical protein [Paenibacillus odorifer]OME55442.1 hypothetical protein BSK59_13270 [Paenibacillus odorifer]
MSIKIGNNNKIKNSSIGNQVNLKLNENEKNDRNNSSFALRHPILLSIIISFTTGLVLLFSFWKNAIDFIEKLF